jgi:hypothetical protein
MSISRIQTGFFALTLVLGALPLQADRTRQSAPSDTSGPPVRVERASPSSGDSSSGRSSQGSGSRARSDAGRTRPSDSGSSAGSPTRVESSRGGRPGRGHSHHYPYYPYRHRYPYHGWYGPSFYWYWPWWWEGPYGYGYPPYRYGYGYGYGRSEDDLGALDLDLAPEKAEVYLDGERIGFADDFDGFPTYLWLPKGTYDLVFYRDGYETIARQYSVYPGVVIDVEDRMVPGASVRPEDLASKSTAVRDDRLRRDEERRAQAQEEEPSAGRRVYAEEPYDARGEPGRLALEVSPEDASVYLDGRLLGAASELRRLHAGLIVDPGPHRLEVVRPGYETRATEFDVEAGEEVTIELDLEREAR